MQIFPGLRPLGGRTSDMLIHNQNKKEELKEQGISITFITFIWKQNILKLHDRIFTR